MKLTRRHVLAAAAAIPAAGMLGGGLLAYRWYDKPVADGLLVLSTGEYDFVQALAEAWMPPGGTPALSGRDADLGRWFDEVLSHMAGNQQTLLKVLVQILDDTPLLTDLSSYTALGLDRRITLLNGWMTSSNALFRAAMSGVIVLMGMGWTTHPEVVAVIGHRFRCGWSR